MWSSAAPGVSQLTGPLIRYANGCPVQPAGANQYAYARVCMCYVCACVSHGSLIYYTAICPKACYEIFIEPGTALHPHTSRQPRNSPTPAGKWISVVYSRSMDKLCSQSIEWMIQLVGYENAQANSISISRMAVSRLETMLATMAAQKFMVQSSHCWPLAVKFVKKQK